MACLAARPVDARDTGDECRLLRRLNNWMRLLTSSAVSSA